jgi:hypothetical protein
MRSFDHERILCLNLKATRARLPIKQSLFGHFAVRDRFIGCALACNSPIPHCSVPSNPKKNLLISKNRDTFGL